MTMARNTMNKLEPLARWANVISEKLSWISMAGVVIIFILNIAEALSVKVFRSPLGFASEFVGFFGVLVVGFAMSLLQLRHGHVRVDAFVNKLPDRVQAWMNATIWFISAIFFALIAWQTFSLGHMLQITGQVTITQRIPFYHFAYVLGISFIWMCIVLLLDFVTEVVRAVKR